jgi:HlyD family secretion protein
MKSTLKLLALLVVFGVAAYAAFAAWQRMTPPPLPPGIAVGNGRIEATDIDVATKFAGRLEDVLVREGDTVEPGQILARMDTRTLAAQYREAEAKAQQRRDARQSAAAIVAQREAELAFAKTEYRRSQDIAAKKLISLQQLDTDRTRVETAQAVLVAARAQHVEAGTAIIAAEAEVERLKAELADAILKAPRHGRVQYRLAEPGEILAAGGRVLTLLDLTDVYMKLFLPESAAGKVAIGAEARLVLDAAPELVIPAKAYFVAAEAQFTPKAVETAQERQKLAFQVRLRIDPELLRRYEPMVKTGVPGVAYVRLEAATAWPARLQVKLPPAP